MQLSSTFVSLLAAISLLPHVLAVGTPFGLASATTGGGSAAAATPTSLAQLTTWLSDSTARTIVLDSLFDFTGTEGTTTGAACEVWTCTPDPQIAIDKDDCECWPTSTSHFGGVLNMLCCQGARTTSRTQRRPRSRMIMLGSIHSRLAATRHFLGRAAARVSEARACTSRRAITSSYRISKSVRLPPAHHHARSH